MYNIGDKNIHIQYTMTFNKIFGVFLLSVILLFWQKNIYVKTNTKYMEPFHAPKIKNLVISGGAATGFSYYGALKELNKQGFWNIDEIESIYATSIGTYLSVFIMLKYPWETLDEYLIKRPWHQLFKFDLNTLFQSLYKGGLYNKLNVYEVLGPILRGKDLSTDITLKSFYEITKIDFHLMTTDMDSFNNIDLSHTTHPEWKLLDAISASSCLPVFFEPFKYEDKTYLDGGIFMNYPIQKCIHDGKLVDEILGVYHNKISVLITEGSVPGSMYKSFFLFTVLHQLISKLHAKVESMSLQYDTPKYEIFVEKTYTVDPASGLLEILYSSEKRKSAIESGVKDATKFMELLQTPI